MYYNQVFDPSTDESKLGESVFEDFIRGNDFVYENVSNNSEYFDYDIDFIVYSKHNKGNRTYDVKTDRYIDTIYTNANGITHINQNFFIELSDHILNESRKGWLYKTKADYIAYVSLKTKNIYIFRVDEMRQFVITQTTKEKIKLASDYPNIHKISVGAIVNWREYLDAGNSLDIFEFKEKSAF